jgi:hypothetical protein
MAFNINDTKFLEIAEIICEEGLSGLDKAAVSLYLKNAGMSDF